MRFHLLREENALFQSPASRKEFCLVWQLFGDSPVSILWILYEEADTWIARRAEMFWLEEISFGDGPWFDDNGP